jgi:hypothetical protein
MLRPEPLMRLSAAEHRFCQTPECSVVYFGEDEVFDREEVVVPVFQKEPAGDRPVCYCFGISDGDIRRQLAEDVALDGRGPHHRPRQGRALRL